MNKKNFKNGNTKVHYYEQIRKITPFIILLISLVAFIGCEAQEKQNGNTQNNSMEWPSYASDKASSKYSPLAQINKSNFKDLTTAWKWESPDKEITEDHPDLQTWVWESTPLMIDGVLYISTSMSQVAAINATNGETIWIYDPETWKNGTPSNNGFVHRGVEYWENGNDKRIIFGTGDGFLIALNAKDGEPINRFGENGRVDLTKGLSREIPRNVYGVSSPPTISNDVIVMGSKVHDVPVNEIMPPGDVRGFDVRTGEQLWTFHSIPHEGEFGNETWEDDSWENNGAANAWTMMSADEELGYVYVPFGTPQNDFYGGQRPGNGLYGESLVCLDARTGKRIWHYQMAHHGVWDYDLPAAPNLIDVNVDGKSVKAIAQPTKQAMLFVLDRVTGKPIWPIDEKTVPQSTISGEKTSPTQPFPTNPLPYDRQGVTEEDVVDFTPELRERALEILEKYNYGPIYTPHSLEKPTIMMPGWAGGSSWAGAAFDPESGIAYVSSVTSALTITMANLESESHAPLVGMPAPIETMDGIPLWKPPYGRITAIDLNTGEHRWMSPLGDLANTNSELKKMNLQSLGRPSRGHLLVTETLLIVGQEGTTQRQEVEREGVDEEEEGGSLNFQTVNPKLVAYDKETGELIGEVELPGNATAAPMTYMIDGRQFIAITTGGANLPAELIVLSLPEK